MTKEMKMWKIIWVLSLTVGWGASFAQPVKLSDKAVLSIHSQTENADRTIFIQLPKDYGVVNKRYPVIILFDAQDQSLYNITSSTVDRLIWTSDIPEAILVGVLQNNRSQELNFEKYDQTALRFLDFIKNDLIGFLNKNYRTNGYLTLIGHSLGGQFVTNAMLTYPEVFKSVISISGALNYPNKDNTVVSNTLNKAGDYLFKRTDSSLRMQKYYFSTGDEGFQDNGFKSGALKLDSLYRLNKSKYINWHFDFWKGYNHMTTPLVSIPAGLTFIYKDWHFSDSLAMDVLVYNRSNPLQVLSDKQLKIQQSYGSDIALPRNSFFQFAAYSLSKGNVSEAEILTKQILDVYPNDDESYSLMAEVYLKKGDTRNSIKYFEKAQSKSSPDKYARKIKSLKAN